MEVKVSIIIPVYGVELFLERAVDSALGQTLAEKEIILVCIMPRMVNYFLILSMTQLVPVKKGMYL